MKRRERYLLGALVVSLVAGGLWPWLRSAVGSARGAASGSLASWQTRLDRALSEQDDLLALRAWQQDEAACALPGEVARAQTIYQNFLFTILQELQIQGATVTPAGVVQHDESLTVVSMQLEFEATSLQVAAFLAACEQARLWHRVAQLSLESRSPDARDRVSARITLEALAVAGLPAAEGYTVDPIEEHHLAGLPSLFPAPAATAEPEDEDDAPRMVSPPRQSPPAPPEIVLVALLGTAAAPEAWLFDRRSQRQQILKPTGEVVCGTSRFRMSAVDADSVTIVGEPGTAVWRLGQEFAELEFSAASAQ